METIDIDFTAKDAQKIALTSQKKRDFVFYKFHCVIIQKIKQRAANNYFNMRYAIPVYLFGQQMYDYNEVMLWLTQRLQRDGFTVMPDYYSRTLYISWRPDPEVKTVSKGKKRTSRRNSKSVSFNLDKNLYVNY